MCCENITGYNNKDVLSFSTMSGGGMLLLSMTGYGYASAYRDERELAAEIRTVNHRFLDLNIRMPRNLFSITHILPPFPLPNFCRVKEKLPQGILRQLHDLFSNVIRLS